MRVVFMGTPDFAVPSLRALIASHDVVAAYTRPDAASGRGSVLRPSPVKEVALEHGIEVRQPRSLRDPAEVASLAELEPDVIVVAAYGMILPAEVLDVPPLGCINVHASLLPRWRGAAPIQRAILAGDEFTGVSIMRMEIGLDTGPFCAVASTPVDGKSTAALTAELAELGASALIDALDRIGEGACTWTEQNDASATYAEKIAKADVALSPDLSVGDLLARVRASSPQAPARLAIADRGATVLEAGTSPSPMAPGAVACSKRSLLIGAADGAIEVTRVKPDGKGPMAACDWARGARLDETCCWTADR